MPLPPISSALGCKEGWLFKHSENSTVFGTKVGGREKVTWELARVVSIGMVVEVVDGRGSRCRQQPKQRQEP